MPCSIQRVPLPAVIGLALLSLLYVTSLSCKAVLRVLLAMLCYVADTALSVRLIVYAGLSLFILNGPYIYMFVCVVYAYNLTNARKYKTISSRSNRQNGTHQVHAN